MLTKLPGGVLAGLTSRNLDLSPGLVLLPETIGTWVSTVLASWVPAGFDSAAVCLGHASALESASTLGSFVLSSLGVSATSTVGVPSLLALMNFADPASLFALWGWLVSKGWFSGTLGSSLWSTSPPWSSPDSLEESESLDPAPVPPAFGSSGSCWDWKRLKTAGGHCQTGLLYSFKHVKPYLTYIDIILIGLHYSAVFKALETQLWVCPQSSHPLPLRPFSGLPYVLLSWRWLHRWSPLTGQQGHNNYTIFYRHRLRPK